MKQGSHPQGAGKLMPLRGTRTPLFLLLAIVAIVGAIWSFMIISAARNETLDQRTHNVASQLKCPICQDESVADSPSLIAQQMRSVIREQLQSGKSEQQVIQYFVERYGSQIVWSPPWQGFTLLAWLVPIALLLAGGFLLFSVLRNWGTRAATVLSDDDSELAQADEAELERYRAEIEVELAEADPIFARARMEAR